MTKLSRNFRSATCILLVMGVLAGSCGTAFAQTNPGRPLASGSSSGAFNPGANPGCNSTVFSSLGTASTFSYAQGYAATYSLVHQPTTYFGCLQGLLQKAQSLLNMFNGTGSLTSFFEGMLKQAVGALLTNLSNKVCSLTGSALMAASSGPAANLISYLNGPPGAPTP